MEKRKTKHIYNIRYLRIVVLCGTILGNEQYKFLNNNHENILPPPSFFLQFKILTEKGDR